MFSEEDAGLVLNSLSNWGPIRVRRVCEQYNCTLTDIFELSDRELRSVKDIGPRSIATLRNWRRDFDIDRELQLLQATNTRFLTTKHPDYPERLKQMPDAPIGLYWRGTRTAETAEVAIVGSRRTSPYGRKIAEDWGRALSEAGITAVSGLARGIDAHAHRGALQGEASTLAVLGSALDRIYPPEHLGLFREIEETGAVISELPFGHPASKTSFPMRNRIVSGMVRLVLVVETDESGGSMITAKFAGDQGKIVAAVPGRIDSRSSAGCHQLIRDGAVLVTSVEDVLEELAWGRCAVSDQLDLFAEETSPAVPDLSPLESQIMAALAGGEMACADTLVDSLAVSFPEVSSSLMMLELKQCIAKRADGSYERV